MIESPKTCVPDTLVYASKNIQHNNPIYPSRYLNLKGKILENLTSGLYSYHGLFTKEYFPVHPLIPVEFSPRGQP